MSGPLHRGELELQRRYGVAEMGGRVAASIRRSIPPIAADFLTRQPFAVASVIDEEERPWAALWSGQPGFLQIVDDVTVRLPAASLDPISRQRIRWPGPVGLLVIQPEARRRMRLNGRARLVGAVGSAEGSVEIVADEVYSNCPQHIQRRRLESVDEEPGEVSCGLGLDETQWARIERADTFFLATYRPGGGADASHRGGPPGFVRRRGEQALEFADFSGNNLFNSLGNMQLHARAGLLFVDFESGDVLQVTGRTELLHRSLEEDDLPGHEGRVVRVDIEEWQEQKGAMPWRVGP